MTERETARCVGDQTTTTNTTSTGADTHNYDVTQFIQPSLPTDHLISSPIAHPPATMSAAVATPTPFAAELAGIAVGANAWLATKLAADDLATYATQFTQPPIDANSPFPPPQRGQPAPTFALPDSTGAVVDLKAVLASGKHVVLFWYRGGWCSFCAADLLHE